MDKVEKSFKKVKEDMDLLNEDIKDIKEELDLIHENMKEILEFVSTNNPQNKTTPTNTSTDNPSFKPLNSNISPISIGNQGVSTDRQTHQQTDRQMNLEGNAHKNTFEKIVEVVNSLDDAKKEIRVKFKNLTPQEFLVFSTIYQLGEERQEAVDYGIISGKLGLTESSIRDYVGRLIKKGIPIDKKRINNKNIQVSISENLKKIASLHTILELRAI